MLIIDLFPCFISFTCLTYFFDLYLVSGDRPLVFIQLCLVPPPPSFSSCTLNLLSTYISPDLFTRCSLVSLFLHGLVVFTVVLVWQYCHHFFSVYVQASSFSFFLACPARASVLVSFLPQLFLVILSGQCIFTIKYKNLSVYKTV